MPPPINATVLAIIRDDLRLTTWLLLGACLQSMLLIFLPTRFAVLPALFFLTSRVAWTGLMMAGYIRDTTLTKTIRGRQTAQFPPDTVRSSKANSENLVVFIIGARFNHPLGRLAPGVMKAVEFFQGMWKEAESGREKWGYLGRSSDMLATDDETGNAIITLSYWKSMQHLHEFARSPVHRAGWEWFEKTTKTHPHLSMMHEVYALPQGHWENIYTNFTPFGMGQIQHVVRPEPGGKQTLVSSLTPAIGARWKTMGSRMTWQGKLD